MAGDDETGVSIIRLTAGLDTGPICAIDRLAIAPGDTYGTLAPRLADLGARLLLQCLDGPISFTDQPEDGSTYAEKIGPDDRTLDPDRSPAELARIVRALDPHIGARIGDLRVLVAVPARQAAPAPGALAAVPAREAAPAPGAPAPGAPGAPVVEARVAGAAGAPTRGVLAAHGGRLLYGAAGGALELLRVQAPGGRPMAAADYLRGHAV